METLVGMNTQDRLQHCTAELVEAARAFHAGRRRTGEPRGRAGLARSTRGGTSDTERGLVPARRRRLAANHRAATRPCLGRPLMAEDRGALPRARGAPHRDTARRRCCVRPLCSRVSGRASDGHAQRRPTSRRRKNRRSAPRRRVLVVREPPPPNPVRRLTAFADPACRLPLTTAAGPKGSARTLSTDEKAREFAPVRWPATRILEAGEIEELLAALAERICSGDPLVVQGLVITTVLSLPLQSACGSGVSGSPPGDRVGSTDGLEGGRRTASSTTARWLIPNQWP